MEEEKVVVNPKLEKFWNFVLTYKLIWFGLIGVVIAFLFSDPKTETLIGCAAIFTIASGMLKVYCGWSIREQTTVLIAAGTLVVYYNLEKTYTERAPVGEALGGLMIFVGAVWQLIEYFGALKTEAHN